MRIVVLVAALISLAGVCSGCGGGGPAPRHGILFAHGIVPVGGTTDGGSDIYVREPDGRLRRVVSTRDLRNEPSWSPDGRLIAFVGTACKGYVDCLMGRPLEVYVANSDGSGQRQLTPATGNAFRSEFPSWSPNGRSIAVLQEFPNSSLVEIVSVASGKIRLLHVHGLISQSVWGKPGIAYLTRQIGSNDVFTIRIADPNTGRGRPFASPTVGYSVQTISWSSRAELAALEASLAYESDKQRVTVYTGSSRRVARFEVPKQWVACGVTWSPDGTWLLLTVYRRGHVNAKTRQPTPQVYTVDPSGKHWQHLRLGLPLASCAVSWR